MKLKVRKLHSSFSGRELSFLAALGFFVFYRIISLSTFYPSYELTKAVRYICVALICFKCIFFDKIKLNSLICLCFLLSLGVIVRLKSGYMTPIITGFFILGAYKVDFDKIVKCFFYIGGTTFLFVFLSSQVGLIPDIVFINWGIQEHSFGYTYTTDFVHQLFFLVIAHVYLAKDKVFKWRYPVIYCMLGVVSYHFCQSRLGSGCIILAALVYIYVNKRNFNKTRIIERFFLRYSILFFAFFTLLSAILYNVKSSFWRWYDQLMTARLSIGRRAFEQYSLSMLGQKINMRGSGRNIEGVIDSSNEYFYLDSGYIYTLFCFGIICFCLLVVGYTLLLKKEYKEKNYFFCAIIILVALHGSISAQILDFVNNIFLLSFLSEIKTDSILNRAVYKGKGRIINCDGMIYAN